VVILIKRIQLNLRLKIANQYGLREHSVVMITFEEVEELHCPVNFPSHHPSKDLEKE
jgi:hypothetical protein